MNVSHIIVAFSGLMGLFIAFYIAYSKKNAHPLACPLKGRCEEVITSKYSKFLGIPVEYLGISYYLFTFITYSLFIFVNQFFYEHYLFALLVMLISAGAFLFSVYLTAIQLFVLKWLCTWCLISAMICTVIFIAVFYNLNFALFK
jgi:uncharacterized membrane protein